MAPIVHGLEAKYQGQILFTYLDIDDKANDSFKQALGFRGHPHYLLLDAQGNVLNQWVGPVSQDEFEAAFEAALSP